MGPFAAAMIVIVLAEVRAGLHLGTATHSLAGRVGVLRRGASPPRRACPGRGAHRYAKGLRPWPGTADVEPAADRFRRPAGQSAEPAAHGLATVVNGFVLAWA